MHIALCSPDWPLSRNQNGIITYVHWMKLELERLGHRVSIFINPAVDPGEQRVYQVERGPLDQILHRVATKFGSSAHDDVLGWGPVIGETILRVHRRDPIDIVEMEETFGWSADVARVTGLPVVVKLHGPSFLSMIDEELATDFGRACVEREGWSLAQAHAIASPCERTLHQTIERYGLHPAISQHVVNPVALAPDTPLWTLDGCDRDTLLFVGRFDKRKGGDLVLDAFARVLADRPNLKLVFAGPDRGLLQDDGSTIRFQDYLAATFAEPLRGRIDYRGPLPQAAIGRLRTQAMLTVVASRWENQGYTALEALLQGCPVISSDAGGGPELVSHGRNGLLFRTGDAADLAAQVETMLADPEAAARMGAAARQFALDVHAAPRVASQSLALFERVIASRGAATA